MDRSKDWLKQAERDLKQAKLSMENGFYEWACFVAQQAAEKAIKALCEKHRLLVRTHQLLAIMKTLGDLEDIPSELYEKGAVLDRFYVPTRYPNGFTAGAPMEYFFQKDAEEAISYAEAIIRFCSDKITRQGNDDPEASK